GQPWEAVIGYSKDKTVYGWVKKPTFVMKLDGPQLDKFKTLSVSFVREKKKAFDFDKAGITSLKYKAISGKEKSFDKTNPDFSKLVDNLASFQVAEYFSGLRKPQFENTLDLKNENGETVFSFAFGPAYENKKIFGDQKLYLAQTVSLSKPSEIFLVDDTVVKNVTGHDLFKENTTPPKPPTPGQTESDPASEPKKPEGHP
ncbi:MAG: hypothetical protein ACK5P5_05350, partial [Pseudobdellovibrionaceae bacterium]